MADDQQHPSPTLPPPRGDASEPSPVVQRALARLAELRAAVTAVLKPASKPAVELALEPAQEAAMEPAPPHVAEGAAQAAAEPQPSLSWSNSQQSTFDGCARARYFATELAPQGWRKTASDDARLAMRLKTLTTLDLAVGNVLHDRAAQCADAVRVGDPLPRLATLRQRASTRMRYVWTSSMQRFDQWQRYPREVPMLLERYYGRGPTLERGAQAAEKLERGLVALHDLGLWEELAACDPSTILTPEKRTEYILPDPLGVNPVRVWAVPDLVCRLPDGAWVVVDHKSGRVTNSDAYRKARRQVVGYGAWLRHGLRVLGPDEGCEGRITVLSDGTEDTFWISADEITAAEEDIRRGALAMAAARERADVAEQAAVAQAEEEGTTGTARTELVQLARRAAYPMTRNRDACRFCPYLELCAPEQAKEVEHARVAMVESQAADPLEEVA